VPLHRGGLRSRSLAPRDDLDAVIHLGDYIYEYGDGEYGDVRGYEPPHEIVTLADYRMRYSQYRRDPDLQEIHRRHPFITVWDDHESANDAWAGGAENHQPETEGSWAERRAAAEKVYSEWMPIRDQADGRIFRALAYGELLDLMLLDTRLWGRDRPLLSTADPGTRDPQRELLGADQEACSPTPQAKSTRLRGNPHCAWSASRRRSYSCWDARSRATGQSSGEPWHSGGSEQLTTSCESACSSRRRGSWGAAGSASR